MTKKPVIEPIPHRNGRGDTAWQPRIVNEFGSEMVYRGTYGGHRFVYRDCDDGSRALVRTRRRALRIAKRELRRRQGIYYEENQP